MKTINHSFSADLNSAELLAESLGGKVEGNFLIIPEDVQRGVSYYSNCAPGINALFVDVEYKEDLLFKRGEVEDDSYIGLHYNLTGGEQAYIEGKDFLYPVGEWHYDLVILDSSVKSDYFLKNGSKSHVLYIYIKKDVINRFLKEMENIKFDLDSFFYSDKNSGARFEKMSYGSFIKLQALRNKDPNDVTFELYLNATVNFLISNFIDKIQKERLILDTFNREDLDLILNAQKYLFENIDKPFPTIEVMAKEANMSATKFKNLFKKVTGETPNNYYLKYKLVYAKSLLEKGIFSVSQISDQLFSTNISYFSTKFKELFGIPPREFVENLK